MSNFLPFARGVIAGLTRKGCHCGLDPLLSGEEFSSGSQDHDLIEKIRGSPTNLFELRFRPRRTLASICEVRPCTQASWYLRN
jgi:hypothetical protein